MKKFISITLILSMVFTSVACGNNNATTDSSTDSSTTTDTNSDSTAETTDEIVPIRWLTTGDTAAGVIQEGDRIVEIIEKEVGIELVLDLVPEGGSEKINVAMASGDFPDIVTGVFGSPATQQWIENGMVIALDDYFAENENIKNWLEPDYDWARYEDKHYGLASVALTVHNTLDVTRKDWLDNLGLEYPTTLEEYEDVLTQFTFNDPDGNGKDDTYGYTTSKPEGYNVLLSNVYYAYGQEYGDFVYDENGNIVPWFEDPSFIPATEFVKRLWEKGVIDPEVMLNDTPKKEEKFYQGKAGIMPAALFRHATRIENSLQELNPEATITYGPPVVGPTGASGQNKATKNGIINCVTTASKYPAKSVEFLDYMISDEGRSLVLNGVEGIHYTMEDGKVIPNEEERAKDSFAPNGWAHPLAWGSILWPLDINYVPDADPDAERARHSVEVASAAIVPNLVKVKTPAEIEDGKVVQDVFAQYYSDMLQNKISIEEGLEKLGKEWRAQGGDKILEEAAAAVAEAENN